MKNIRLIIFSMVVLAVTCLGHGRMLTTPANFTLDGITENELQATCKVLVHAIAVTEDDAESVIYISAGESLKKYAKNGETFAECQQYFQTIRDQNRIGRIAFASLNARPKLAPPGFRNREIDKLFLMADRLPSDSIDNILDSKAFKDKLQEQKLTATPEVLKPLEKIDLKSLKKVSKPQ